MRLRASVVFGAAIGLATLLLLYQLVSLPPDTSSVLPHQRTFEALEDRLQRLEKDISLNQDTIQEIHGLLGRINNPIDSNVVPQFHPRIKPPLDSLPVAQPPPQQIKFNSSFAKLNGDDCTFAQSSAPNVDILMEDVYRELPFDNPDGGAWKQGWDISYDQSQWSVDKPLKVFVVPHSHCDPGWLKTFERYYSDQVTHILDNMVRKLELDPRRRFIYAEISFFSMWFEKQSSTIKEKVKKLLSQGQLELVTGGWVMPDEAVTHYWSMIDQLVTGHEWLRTNLNYKPNNGWAVDPFGLSPTMAYVLKRSGLENMLIQRGHYAIKKYLAASRNLEFRWRQSWDLDSTTEILCQLMPFYSYDVPHTCGPDPKVCCQFDFKRLPGSRVTCPWRVAPQPITSHNVKSKAEQLLDQYRKKAQLYRTNVLLIPLGDDFRYDTAEEWDAQFSNYQKLFDHLNSQTDYHTQAQFGTLSDYFHALREESRSMQPGGGEDEEGLFPSLTGDFFTYSDRDDHYWSGYFTSRPYHKARSRQLAALLRATEILFSLATATVDTTGPRISQAVADALQPRLLKAHQSLGLFQHHDGITGTAKDHVVIDYASKLLEAIQMTEHVLQFVAHALLAPSSTDNQFSETKLLEVGEEHDGITVVSTPRVLKLTETGRGSVIVYNSHPHDFQGLVTVRVDTPYVRLVTGQGHPVMCQVDPVFDGPLAGAVYDVHFPVELKPLSLSRFVLAKEVTVDTKYVFFPTISVRSQDPPHLPKEFIITSEPSETAAQMAVGSVAAVIGTNGLMQRLTMDGVTSNVAVQFVSYRAKSGSEMSGAYLFLPAGSAEPVELAQPPPFRIVEGPLQSTLTTKMPLVTHIFTMTNSPGNERLSIRNLVQVKAQKNFELAMRLVSEVDNKDVFYTDLNGFQIVRHVRHDKLTLQGNYYPVASQIFIEDQKTRLSLLTQQPHGGSSLAGGQVEVMLDRRLMQDDHRGLEQGVTDNVLTSSVFRLLVEHRAHSVNDGNPKKNAFSSLLAESALRDLLFPPILLQQTYKSSSLKNSWKASPSTAISCDIELISMRSLRGSGGAVADSTAALTLRRTAFDCSFPPPKRNCITEGGKVQLSDILGSAFGEEVRQTTLTHMYAGINITKSYTLTLQPMELYAFLLNPTQLRH